MAEERCDLSDLPVSQCACMVHAREEREQPSAITAWFPSRFDWSRCADCNDIISKGELIARTEDGYYICERCAR